MRIVKVDPLITRTFDRLRQRQTEFLDKAAEHAGRNDDKGHKDFVRKAVAAGRSLANFEAILLNMPPQFMLSVQCKKSEQYKTPKSLRADFNGKVRARYLRFCGLKKSRALLAMGLKDGEIKHMAKHGTLPRMKGGFPDPKHDMTVDHEIDLSLGGGNHQSNLRLVPHHVNYLRHIFLSAQLLQGELPDQVLLLRYKGSDFVPRFPNGFRARDQRIEAIKARIEEDFGIEWQI